MKRLAMLLLLFALPALSADSDTYRVPASRKPTEFHFARLKYPGIYGDDNLKNWYTDYPEMDRHVSEFLNRLTGIRTDDTLVVPSHAALFSLPFIYTVEPEQMKLSTRDVEQLREYLSRGGFWIMDDFHGDEDWIPTMKTIHRILPKAEPVELKITNPLFHCFFDIDAIQQVLNDSLAECDTCEPWENGPSGRVPKVFAVYDDAHRPQIVMAFNTDLGDGLEWADDPKYSREMSGYAIRFLSNVAVYAMTH